MEVKEHPGLCASVIGEADYLEQIEGFLGDGIGARTAFLCSGDSYALNVMRWSSQKGLHIPEDFGLMGFDNINVLDYILPRLTTVSTNLEGVAVTAVSELLQEMESGESYEPKTIFLKYEILDRETL
jgi:LacI family transcriptional regulator